MENDFEEKNLIGQNKVYINENKTPKYCKVASFSIISKIFSVIHSLVAFGFLCSCLFTKYENIIANCIIVLFWSYISCLSIFIHRGAYGSLEKWLKIQEYLGIVALIHCLLHVYFLFAILLVLSLVDPEIRSDSILGIIVVLLIFFVLDVGSMITTVHRYRLMGRPPGVNYLTNFYYSNRAEKNTIIKLLVFNCSLLIILLHLADGCIIIHHSFVKFEGKIIEIVWMAIPLLWAIYMMRQAFIPKQAWEKNKRRSKIFGIANIFYFIFTIIMYRSVSYKDMTHYWILVGVFVLNSIDCLLTLFLYRNIFSHEAIEEKSEIGKII